MSKEKLLFGLFLASIDGCNDIWLCFKCLQTFVIAYLNKSQVNKREIINIVRYGFLEALLLLSSINL